MLKRVLVLLGVCGLLVTLSADMDSYYKTQEEAAKRLQKELDELEARNKAKGKMLDEMTLDEGRPPFSVKYLYNNKLLTGCMLVEGEKEYKKCLKGEVKAYKDRTTNSETYLTREQWKAKYNLEPEDTYFCRSINKQLNKEDYLKQYKKDRCSLFY
ncbi:hypothetical protein CCY99_03440 [Helicobacter sp. 16-1353]|uniref:hypothetical protein n=1 Tax=Helicobacter sp. 16-1353 TaxID=2004996 RepID=UPI000DCB0931|nr:hypothetical protein [Helicobacter sp. 16-1353]RAX54419.1 hypothetical protein CCY99_03440 [Helicobacter sp. 16-1353]